MGDHYHRINVPPDREFCPHLARAEKAEARVRELEAQKNGAYSERNKCVALIAHLARLLDWASGTRQHEGTEPWDDDWRTVVFIDLPTGQISWHLQDAEKPLVADLPHYEGTWDGHSTEEKYRRCSALRGVDK